jgi:hypothetical protein
MSDLRSVVPSLAPSAAPSADGPKYDLDKALLDDDSVDSIVVESEEEEPPVVPIKREKGEKGEEEDLVEGEEEEEEEEEKEEEEPPKIAFGRPSIKDIKAKYPEFFQDFPDIKEAIFREAKYTQYFPTVEDAKEAVSDNEVFNVLSDAALAGNSAPLLESLAKTDEKALKSFSASFLQNLYKQNQEVYTLAVTPIFENFFRQAYMSGDENMKNSALNLAQFLFGEDGEDSVTGKKTVSKVAQILEDTEKSVKAREEGLTAGFRATAAYVGEQASKNLKLMILKDFDPNKVFTPTIRGMLVEEIIKKIDKQLSQDQGHKTVMGARWRRARSNGYTDDDKSKLLSTYLARAKSLIPTVREQVRSAALGKAERSAEVTRGKVRVPAKEVNGGPPRGTSSKGPRDYSKMTDMEILNS